MIFRVNDKISASSAKQMILENCLYSDYQIIEMMRKNNIQKTISNAEKLFKSNESKPLDDYMKDARIFSNFCYKENILDYSPHCVTSSDGKYSIKRYVGDSYYEETYEGACITTLNPIDGIFIDSYNCFKRSIENSDKADFIADFVSAINKGISAIECAIRVAASDYNCLNGNEILVDNKSNKISFDKKIDDWIPKITGGKIDKSSKVWQSFIKLKIFRDDYDQHFKGNYNFKYADISKLMNIYKYGIAEMLFNIEVLVDKRISRRISSAIIRAKHFPEIELLDN